MRVFWYNSTLGLTLDTVSIIVTQYNNTAITRTTTIHGDVNSLDINTITTALKVASAFVGGNIDYFEQPPVYLATGTDGSLLNGKSMPYLSPYAKFMQFAYSTITEQSPNCPAGQQDVDGKCVCKLTSWYLSFDNSVITLPEPYYSIFNDPLDGNIQFIQDNVFEIDTVALSEWVASDTALMSAMPQLSTCFYLGYAHGPPGAKIPVSALTATSSTTVQGSGQYSSHTAQPANTVTTLFPAPTSKPPVSSKTSPAPSKPPTAATEDITPSADSNFNFAILHPYILETAVAIAPDVESNKALSSLALVLSDPLNSLQSSPGNLVHKNPNPQSPNSASLNTGSQSDSPQSPKSLKPPNPDTNNIVYSLAPLAATITSNDNLILLNHVGQATYTKPEPTAILSFGTSIYTANSLTHFVISGQTVKPGGPAITVAGTLISLNAAGHTAVIGTSTQSLIALSSFQKALALTFAGSIFTANSASQFVVAGQTLTQGGQITVSNIPISLNSDGRIVVIGTSTNYLIKSYAPIITHAPVSSQDQETPVLTLGRSTFIANMASQFVIAGQTLTQGGQITVSGTPISLAQNGKTAIIGTSTQPLIPNNIPTPTQTPILTFGASTYTADLSSHFVVAGQTIIPGHIISVSGIPISLAENGKFVIIGTSTQLLIPDGTPTPTRAPSFTRGATVYTADLSSHFIIDGQTLVPGGVLTIAGTRVSYDPAGRDIVVGTSTEAVQLGNLIMQGLGSTKEAARTAVPTTGVEHPGTGPTVGVQRATGGAEGFTGAAHRVLGLLGMWRWRWGGVAGLMVGLCVL